MPDEPKHRLTTDEKRARVILVIVAVAIAMVAVGIAAIATTLGAPLWLGIAIALIATGVFGLFMFLELA